MISTSFTNKKRKYKIYGIAGAALTLAIPFVMHLAGSAHSLEAEQSLCPFKMLTGLPCPGCGITKSLVFLYEGDFYRSVYYHIFGIPTFLFSIGLLILLPTELATGKEYFNSLFYSKKVGWTLAAIMIAYHFVRLCFFIASHSADEILRESIWR